jgi:signal peptidase
MPTDTRHFDDTAGATIHDLIRAHGRGFSEDLRLAIEGDRDAARSAVAHHLGFPTLGGASFGRTGARRKLRWRLLGFLWAVVSIALLLATLGLAVFLLVLPRTVGAVPVTILSGSMRPAMTPGTLAVVRPVDPGSLRLGDVVTYQAAPDDRTLITHRVTELTTSPDGERQFTLRGDDNDAPDAPIHAEQIRGKVVYAVRYLGWITDRLATGEGPERTRWAAYALLVYGTLMLLGVAISRFGTPRTPRLAQPSREGRARVADGISPNDAL